MLVLRADVSHLDLPRGNLLPKEVVAHVDVLRVRIDDGVVRKRNRPLIVFLHRHQRHRRTRQEKQLNLPQEQ